MAAQVFNSISLLFDSILTWFSRLFASTGMIPFYLGAIVVVLSVRFLLKPILGSKVGSDSVRKRSDSDDG